MRYDTRQVSYCKEAGLIGNNHESDPKYGEILEFLIKHWITFGSGPTNIHLYFIDIIYIIVEKSPNSSNMYDHGFMDNTNRQAVCKSQKSPLSDLQTAEELHWKP